MVSAFTSPLAVALVRWVAFGAASLILGALVSRWIARRTAGAPAVPVERIVRWASGVLAVACLIRLAQQSLALAAEPSAAWPMAATLLRTTWGYAWLVQVLSAICLWGCPRLTNGGAPWSRLGAAVLGLAVCVPPAFQGHAIGAPAYTAIAVLADALHLAASGVWIGTLAVLVVQVLPVARGSSARAAIAAFSPLALTSAAVLAATGSLASWLHVRHVPLLWGTTYGRVLLLKLALVLGVAGIGAVNWRRLTPRLTEPEGLARLARAARVEVTVAAAVLLVTAFLVATPLPGE